MATKNHKLRKVEFKLSGAFLELNLESLKEANDGLGKIRKRMGYKGQTCNSKKMCLKKAKSPCDFFEDGKLVTKKRKIKR